MTQQDKPNPAKQWVSVDNFKRCPYCYNSDKLRPTCFTCGKTGWLTESGEPASKILKSLGRKIRR